jgi:phospholipid/cholesterol/gamma-HCH transport system substrate-binding protein
VKKTSVDFVVGGSILLALLVMISGVLWLKEVSVTRKMVRYTVLFPNLGGLQIGDPVLVNGVKMGTVASEELLGIKVKVVLNLDKSVELTDSSSITVMNIGLMGERTVGIQLSEKGARVQPNDKKGKHVTYLVGHFDTGIAEAVGMLGTVLGDVQVLVKNVDGIVKGTLGDTSFTTFFHRVVGRLDTVTQLVDVLVRENKDNLTQSLSHVQTITAEIDRLLKDNQDNVKTILANGSDLTTRAVHIATEVESVSVSLRSMVATIDRGEGTVGMLYRDPTFFNDLKRTVGQLDTLITDVNDRGLKLRIKLGFRDDKKSK